MKHQTVTTRYFYQNGKLAVFSEIDQHRTIFRAFETPLAEQATGGHQDTSLLVIDQNNSVLKTLGNYTEDNTHSYSAYGHAQSQPSERTAIGYNGERINRNTAGYPLGNGYREISPVLMRFHVPDSLSPFDRGGLNTYCYCLGDPVNRIDPDGHFSLFKPRTWLRRDKTIIKQRFKALRDTNDTLAQNTTRLKELQNNRELPGRFKREAIHNITKALNKDILRAKRKIQGMTDLGKSVDASYSTPYKQAQAAINGRSLDVAAFNSHQANAAYEARQTKAVNRPDYFKDQHDDRNYTSPEQDAKELRSA